MHFIYNDLFINIFLLILILIFLIPNNNAYDLSLNVNKILIIKKEYLIHK